MHMLPDPTTRERAEQLARMAEGNEIEAYGCERDGHFGLANALRARAEDYRRLSGEILRKLAASVEPGEVAAFVGVCLCGLVAWTAAWVLFS